MPMNSFFALLARIISSSLAWMAALSRFWVLWIRNTIRKVMMVVEVLITNCQVSEKPNSGPLAAQAATRTTQTRKVTGRPVQWATKLATGVKVLDSDMAGTPSGGDDPSTAQDQRRRLIRSD